MEGAGSSKRVCPPTEEEEDHSQSKQAREDSPEAEEALLNADILRRITHSLQYGHGALTFGYIFGGFLILFFTVFMRVCLMFFLYNLTK